MKSFINKFKMFYQNKRGKMILFFGFYLIFFIFLALFLRSEQNDIIKEENDKKIKEESTITSIHSLFDNNFTYYFEINDNGNMINFSGNKNNLNYLNYENKYFLDYININQLIKKSRVLKSDSNITYYEISNDTLNELLNTEVLDGVNEIKEINGINNKEYKVYLNLTNYFGRSYIINLTYKVGDNFE